MTPPLELLLTEILGKPRDETRILSHYTDFVATCGLDHFTIGLLLSEEAVGSDELTDRIPIWTSMPDAWMEEYNTLGYREHDYVIQQIARETKTRSSMVFAWGEDIADLPQTGAETSVVLRGAGEAGLAQAITFFGLGPEGGEVLQFAASIGSNRISREEVNKRIQARQNELVIAAFAMAPHLRAAGERLRRDVIALSAREKDVLGRYAQGLRPDRIADAMGISSRTVNMHASNARKKLKSGTMAEATAVAIRCGFL